MHLDVNLATIVQVLVAAALVGVVKSLWSLNTAVANLGGQFKEHVRGNESQFESIENRLNVPQDFRRYLDRP